MRLPDDCNLGASHLARVQSEAKRALLEAGAMGVFPTPIDQIMRVANVEEIKEDVLSPSFIARLRGSVSGALKGAVAKVLGLFHASAGLIYIDQTLMAVKKRFVRLHEAGHGYLPWHRPMYALVEDCEKSLDPFSADLFDREANVFASEVLFQLNTFRDMAEAEPFGIFTPVRLAKKFDASIYASVRQYVSKNHRACAVVVLNIPVLVPGDGFRSTLRRAIQSERFSQLFGQHDWREAYSPDDEIGALIPVGSRRASGKRGLYLVDQNGVRHDCIAESFTQGYQIFVLIHVVGTLGDTFLLHRAD